MTFAEKLQACIDSGFDGYADFLMEICVALDEAGMKPKEQTKDGE